MARADRVGDKYRVAVSRGEIEWKPEPWGAVVTEVVYGAPGVEYQADERRELRVPWSTLESIRETAPVKPKDPVKFQFRGMDADVVVELKGRHGTIRVPIGDFASFSQSEPFSAFGEFRIAVGAPLMERLYLASDEYGRKMGP